MILLYEMPKFLLYYKFALVLFRLVITDYPVRLAYFYILGILNCQKFLLEKSTRVTYIHCCKFLLTLAEQLYLLHFMFVLPWF
jgi:hypothetical protein